MGSQNLRFAQDARERMLHGVDVVAETVKVTLGPRGRNVMVERPHRMPLSTKDGVAVARRIWLADRFENMGAQLVIQAASDTSETVGDGTTTATVLAQAIARKSMAALAAGLDPMDVKRGIDAAVGALAGDLRERSQPVSSLAQVAQVGTISANGDTTIGDLLSQAMDQVGMQGVIVVEESPALNSRLEVVRGLEFQRGYLSPFFITDQRQLLCELEEPLIFLTSARVEAMQPLLPLLEAALQARRPLLIIAEDIEGPALSALIANKRRGGLQVAGVKAPGFADGRNAVMEDIALMTGADYVTEGQGRDLRGVTAKALGQARRATISKDTTIIADGQGERGQIEARCRQIQAQIESAPAGYDCEVLKERLGRLSTGIATIHVGGTTEVEAKERRSRFVNAVNSTQAAVEDGILPGGGVALLRSAGALNRLTAANDDQHAGIDIVRRAVEAPLRQIAENAAANSAIIVDKLIERSDPNWGYDASIGEYCDMLERGIVDSTKIVCSALEAAASVAGLMISTEAMVAEVPEPARKLECGHGHGHGHGHSHCMGEMF